MKPGRELDALVAREVMGLKGLDINSEDLAHLPMGYSTSIEAAWQIVGKLNGFDLELSNADGWIAEFTDATEMVATIHQGLSLESAPHAICLAALKAVGYE